MSEDNSPKVSVVTGDRSESEHDFIPVVLILDRLRSAHNVGNLFRLADAVRAEKVLTCGYTATPPHPKLKKTAMGTDEFVLCEHYETTPEAVKAMKGQGYEIVAVETVDEAESIWDAEFSKPTALVLGNEALGVQDEVLELCDRFVKLPAYGLKNSINVSNCAAVVLFKVAECFKA